MTYSSVDARERSDASFRNRRQTGHHHGPSLLETILPHINMIFFFVLDFMHLCCSGIMKRLLEYWLAGDLSFRLRVSSRDELSRRMNVLYSQIPSEFQRKARSTKHVKKWKTVKYRFFLLYCGPIIMKKILRVDLYNHFLLLHAACRLLCSRILCHQYKKQAKQYLRTFFTALKELYGQKSQNLNANCNLTEISAFSFENFLCKLKNFVRTPYRPLQQICRRLSERNFFFKKATVPVSCEVLTKTRGSILKIRYKENILTNSAPNNAIVLKTKRLKDEHSNQVKTVPLALVKSKLVKLKLSFEEKRPERVFVVPFLH